MANTTINYVSLQRLAYYDGKIKAFLAAADAATLKAAQDYCDSLAENYDAAGVAASLVQALENGQVKANKEAIEALTGRVVTLEGTVATQGEDIETMKGQIDALEKGTYDDTEVRELIQGNADDIAEVSGKVDTLVGEDVGKSARTIANEELAKQLIAEGAKESLDTLAEIAAWIQAHPDDASAMNKAIEDLEALIGTLPEGVTATTIVAYIQEAVKAEETRALAAEAQVLVDAKAYADEKVGAEKERAEGVEAGLNTRLEAVEAQLGDGENSVSDLIAAAKQEAIDTAAGDATTKADTAESNAKKYADDLNTAMDTRVKAVESAKHTHSNQTVLDGVTAEKVAAWDASEQNAKDYADGLDEAMDTRVKAVEGKAHEHANKALLDTYTQTEANLADAVAKKHEHANAAELAKIEDGDVAKWDEAYTKAHEHTNKAVLDGITAGNVSSWSAAEQNAKNYADQEIAKIDTGVMAVATGSANGTVAVDGNDVAVKGLGSAAYTAASAYEVAGAAATAESNAKAFATEEIGKIDLSGIDTNASAITALQGEDTAIKGRLDALEAVTHTEITEADIDNLFLQE